jgi:hypothetical protein
MDRKVGFNITPIVHVYKKRQTYIQKQQQELQMPQEQSQKQEQILPSQEEDSNQPLKIGIPQVYTEEVCEEPPAYDNSPMSPRTQQEIRYLRVQEQQSRVAALTNAIIDFTNTASPESIIGLSPLNLSVPTSPLCLSSQSR